MMHNLFVRKGLVTMACSTFPTQRAEAYPSVRCGGWLAQIITSTVTFSPLKGLSLHAVEQHNHHWANCFKYRCINTCSVLERLELADTSLLKCNTLSIMLWWKLMLDAAYWVTSIAAMPLQERCLSAKNSILIHRFHPLDSCGGLPDPCLPLSCHHIKPVSWTEAPPLPAIKILIPYLLLSAADMQKYPHRCSTVTSLRGEWRCLHVAAHTRAHTHTQDFPLCGTSLYVNLKSLFSLRWKDDQM